MQAYNPIMPYTITRRLCLRSEKQQADIVIGRLYPPSLLPSLAVGPKRAFLLGHGRGRAKVSKVRKDIIGSEEARGILSDTQVVDIIMQIQFFLNAFRSRSS